MKLFDKAEEAVEHFKNQGGAMNYVCSSSQGPRCWQTGTAEEIQDVIQGSGNTVREATEFALILAGVRSGEVDYLLKDWR